VASVVQVSEEADPNSISGKPKLHFASALCIARGFAPNQDSILCTFLGPRPDHGSPKSDAAGVDKFPFPQRCTPLDLVTMCQAAIVRRDRGVPNIGYVIKGRA
jgi:hypothetical protein